jgi:hypothetical protein
VDLTEVEEKLESQDALAPTGISELLTSVVQWAVELMRADGGLIQLWDPDRAVLAQAISCGICKAFDGATLRPGEGLGGKILQSGKRWSGTAAGRCWPSCAPRQLRAVVSAGSPAWPQ